jgi:hypothetical protein
MNNSPLPIDVVYTWVDGNDPLWIEKNRKYLDANRKSDAARPARFANHDELMFSLRGVERYLPWIRKIHIVTDKQVPSWLKVDHPKIHIVDHSEIFPDPACLPTFNSVAIEANLHHIPGLAEHFIYFNDDMMPGGPFEPGDFYAPDGRPYSFIFIRKHFDFGSYYAKLAPVTYRHMQEIKLRLWLFCHKNNRPSFSISLRYNELAILQRMHRAIPYYKTNHTPIAHTKSNYAAIEEIFKEDFEACRKHRFRSGEDLFFPELFATVGLMTGRSLARYYQVEDMFYFHFGRNMTTYLSELKESEYKFININDGSDCIEESESDAYIKAMNRIYPIKSAFEK